MDVKYDAEILGGDRERSAESRIGRSSVTGLVLPRRPLIDRGFQFEFVFMSRDLPEPIHGVKVFAFRAYFRAFSAF